MRAVFRAATPARRNARPTAAANDCARGFFRAFMAHPRGRKPGDAGCPAEGRCRKADAPLELQALWPSLPSMKDGDDLKVFTSQPVRNHVGCAWNHELARAGDSSRTPKIRQPGQTFDSREDRYGNTGRCVGVVACDVSTKVSKVTDRARRPDDGQARGAFRSRFRPHERSHADASL